MRVYCENYFLFLKSSFLHFPPHSFCVENWPPRAFPDQFLIFASIACPSPDSVTWKFQIVLFCSCAFANSVTSRKAPFSHALFLLKYCTFSKVLFKCHLYQPFSLSTVSLVFSWTLRILNLYHFPNLLTIDLVSDMHLFFIFYWIASCPRAMNKSFLFL